MSRQEPGPPQSIDENLHEEIVELDYNKQDLDDEGDGNGEYLTPLKESL